MISSGLLKTAMSTYVKTDLSQLSEKLTLPLLCYIEVMISGPVPWVWLKDL